MPSLELCDCICNCRRPYLLVGERVKGTNGCLCAGCWSAMVESHDPRHAPWPADGVMILPPEKK